jgi:predicted CoA-binding protein
MKQLLERFFSSPAYAVVGASESSEKYGNIVYRYLKDKKFPVYPVNPYHTEVEGNKCYANVSELPDDVKSVVIVVPPEETDQVVVQCKAKGITAVWMQPGAESFEAIEHANEHNIAAIYDACVMVMLAPVRTFKNVKPRLRKATQMY